MVATKWATNVRRCTVVLVGALLLFIASSAHASTPPTTSDGASVPLHGRIIHDQSLSLETAVVNAKYVHFRPKYAPRRTERRDEDLPSGIPVDEKGRFEIDRERQPMLLYCETADGKLAGAGQVDSDTHDIEIELKPVTLVRGRLIDHKTGEPLAGERLFVGIHFHSPQLGVVETGLFSKGAVTTDESGRFEFSSLVDGQKYDLTGVKIDKQDDGPMIVSVYSLGTFVANGCPGVDVGDVCQLRAHFASDALPSDRLGEALKQAASYGQHVLIVFSSPGDQAFRLFENLRIQDDGFRDVLDGFKVVVIDRAGEHATDAVALAKRLKVELPEDGQGTCFCFLDDSGSVVEGLSVTAAGDRSFPRKELFDAAVNNSSAFPDSHALFIAALKQAGEEDKQVLIQETGPNCGPCKLMSRFMDSTRDYWSQDFVWLRLDQRWPGTMELTERLRGRKTSSIPWYAVLSREGQVRFTSFDQTGDNMGFPGSERSRMHFRKMLENHSSRMTEMCINAMLSELDN